MAPHDVVQKTLAAYERIAREYRAANSGPLPNTLARLAGVLAGGLRPGAHVIDLGCGIGRDMAWLEELGLRATGVDLSPAMLAQARALTAGVLLQMDMRALAFADSSFDAAWCSAALLHLPRLHVRPALSGVRRVLRPGASLMVSVKQGHGESWVGGYVDGVTRFFTYFSATEMRDLLRSAGFHVRTFAVDHAERNWLSFLARRD